MNHLLHLLTQKGTVFQVIFDSRLGISQKIRNVESIQLEQIRRFKGINFFHRHDIFYLSYPECMKSILQEADYDNFKECWNKVHEVKDGFNIDEYMLLKHIPSVLGQIEYNTENRIVQFQITSEVLYSFGNIFILIRYIPIDESQPQAIGISEKSGCFTLWDYVDIDTLLEDYRIST